MTGRAIEPATSPAGSGVWGKLLVAIVSVVLTLALHRWFAPRPGLVFMVWPGTQEDWMPADSVDGFLRKYRDDSWAMHHERFEQPHWAHYFDEDHVSTSFVWLKSDSVDGVLTMSASRSFIARYVERRWSMGVSVTNQGDRPADQVQIAFHREPTHWSMYPTIHGASSTMTSDSVFVIVIPGLGPSERVSIDAVAVNGPEPVVAYVRSEQGPARESPN